MALKIFEKLFRRKRQQHIMLTAEEAYAPLAQESEEPKPSAPVFMPEAAEKAEEAPAPEAKVFEEAEISAEAEAVREAEAAEPEAEPQNPLSLLMFGCLDEPESAKTQIRNGLISAFRSISEDEHGFSCLLPLGTGVSIRILTDQTHVHEQAGFIMTHYASAVLPDSEVKNAALAQLELFNALAVYTLTPPYCEDDVTALLTAVYNVALPVRAFIVNDKMELYRWDKRLVISPDGRTDFTVFVPIKRGAVPLGRADDDSVDAARRARNMEVLKKHGLDIPADMPVQVREADACVRTPEEIVNRLASLFCCALKAQAYTSPREITAPATWTQNVLKRMDAQYGVSRLFSRKEADYIVRGRENQHAAHLLRFESCHVLLWALGLMNMGWPDEPADTQSILRILRDADTEMLLKIAKPRPLNVILNMHDITYRLHSICVRADEETQQAYRIDHDVVYERHYALNWLVAANGIFDWDLVVPKT